MPQEPGAPPSFIVTADEAGLRLDAWLVRRKLAPSAASARRRLAEAGARIDGQVAKKGARVLAGQTIALGAPPPRAALVADELALEVLYEDADLVAINKPAGIPTHPLRARESGTAADALAARFPECRAAGEDPREGGFAHRLDVGTSGVLIAARRPEVYRALRQILSGGGSEKVYLAEVLACPRGSEAGPVVVDQPIGRRGRRSAAVVVGGGRGALAARTEVQLLGPSAARAGAWLVEARLAAGRPHQVRAHLAWLGAPLSGDPVYGGASDVLSTAPGGPGGFRLHALRVRLPHPVTGQDLLIAAPRPVWAALRQET
jgi:23S rRNA pseudouridine1911/1915/1917 synthase